MPRELRSLVQTIGGALEGGRARNLSRVEAADAFRLLLEGRGTPAQVAAIFVAMRSRGMTGDELAGFAQAARARLRFPELPAGAVVIATSRLGKVRHPLVALAAAAAAAACGVPVLVQAAPHAEGAGITVGDLWRRLGGELHQEPDAPSRTLRSACLGFWQPTAADEGWKRLLEIENEIGLRSAPDTVAKLLAPTGCRLLVPARGGPVLGQASEAVANLGHADAVIVQGVEGSLDPFVAEQTRGLCLDGGVRSPLRLEPADLVLDCPSEAPQLHEDRLEASVVATQQALMGMPGPAYHSALLGAALILRLAGRTSDLATAVGSAREAIESGGAQERLVELGLR
jgi:anthranilate phosphoribosyltransferase